MSIFGYNAEAKTETDNLGRDFGAVPTDVYDSTIQVMYMTKTTSGGTALNLIAKTTDGKEIKKTLYVTSMKSGTEKNTYLDKEGKPQYLADFLQADAICLLAVGKPLGELIPEDKLVKIFDFDQKKEVPKKVPTYPDLQDKQVKLAMIRVNKIKQVKGGVDANGKQRYVDDLAGTVVQENTLDKVFRASDNKTVNEVRSQAPAEFMEAWLAKNQGKDKDLTQGKAAQGTAGAPAASSAPTKPLF